MANELYVGVDMSTQSGTAVVFDKDGIIETHSISYDKTPDPLSYREMPDASVVSADGFDPGHGLNGGFWALDAGIGEYFTCPLTMTRAFHTILAQVSSEGRGPLIRGIGIAAQQHGATFGRLSNAEIASQLDPTKTLEQNLMDLDAFSRNLRIDGVHRPVATLWKNSNTDRQVRNLSQDLKGATLLDLTKNPAHHRFTGFHIRRFADEDPVGYQNTEAINTFSSLFPGFLTGKSKVSEGLGTALENIHTRQYDPALVQALVPGYDQRPELLPHLVSPRSQMHPTVSYFKEVFGIEAHVAVGLGDNIASMLGLGVIAKGKSFVSYGSSNTFGVHTGTTVRTDESGDFCVFGAATGPKDLFTMLVYNNGSHTREHIIREVYGLSDTEPIPWDRVSTDLLQATPRADDMAVYFTQREIVPNSDPKVVRTEGFTANDPYNIVALIEGQTMSARYRLEQIGAMPTELYFTGKAAENPGIAQVIANVMGVPVHTLASSDSAAVGAGLHAMSLHTGRELSEVVKPFVQIENTYNPDPAKTAIYTTKMPKYVAFEERVVGN